MLVLLGWAYLLCLHLVGVAVGGFNHPPLWEGENINVGRGAGAATRMVVLCLSSKAIVEERMHGSMLWCL